MSVIASDPVADFVRLHARAKPAHPALIDAVTRDALSYSALDRRVDAAAALLVGRYEIGPGDRIAVLARNHVDVVVLHLACARAGAILVTLNWRLSTSELTAIVEDCAPRLIVSDGVTENPAVDDVTTIDRAQLGRVIDANTVAPFVGTTEADRPSLMLYTSGTSGRCKGVPLTERNLLATALNFTVLGEVTPASVFLVDSPMFHIIGMVSSIRPALLVGGTAIVSAGFEPGETLARLGDPSLAVTHYFCVPQMAEMLRTHPDFEPSRLRGLTALFTGGAPHPVSRIRDWLRDLVPVADGYGMTEAGTVFGMPPSLELIELKAGSAGLMPPTMAARIVRDDGEPCEVDEVGELQLKGPNIFNGYWRRPDESEAAFTDDKFFRTGDLVRRDADGFHFLVDRKKDMFISGGENVYPAEVEERLRLHPDVAEVAVFGMPDDRWGEVGHAAIVLATPDRPEAETLLAFCREGLAGYKVPRQLHFLERLPRTGSGKVLKGELRKLAGAKSERKTFDHESG